MTPNSPLPRRHFLRAVSATSAALAASSLVDACATSNAALAQLTPTASPRSGEWDMRWLDRLDSKHRVVFNVTQTNGPAFGQAGLWLDGHGQAHGVTDADLNLVMVFRHEAVRMMLNDAMWARLAAPGARTEYRGEMARVASRGAIFLACNMALMGQASTLAQKESLPEPDARAQIRAAVIPGVSVMPNGVFAVTRAQTAGCAYFQPG